MWPISSRRQIQLSQPPEMPESSFSSKGKERKETRTHCRWEKNCFLPYSYSTTNQNKLDSCRWPAILSSVSEITSHFGLHIGLGALSLAKELQSFCPDHIQEAPTLSLKGICNKQKQKQKKGGGGRTNVWPIKIYIMKYQFHGKQSVYVKVVPGLPAEL